MLDFIEARSFGTLVSSSSSGLMATHIPVTLNRGAGELGTIEGHIARANSQHRDAQAGVESLFIFTGVDCYITPNWYPGKREHGKDVPTWNYIAVHAYGLVRFRDDDEFLYRQLTELTTRHEGKREHPWAVTDAPEEYIRQQMRAIVGFEMPVARIEGKWKMSQNRSAADIDGVVAGLRGEGTERGGEVAGIVEQRRRGVTGNAEYAG